MKSTLVLLISALVLAGCASTNFKTFETRGESIIEGQGGTKTVHEGMDVWDYGDPPRKFKVLGIIEDERPGGIIPMSQLKSDVVRKAREAGGQALIQIRSEAQIVGYQTFGSASATAYGNRATATGFSTTAPLRKNYARFAVIQYID
jgi:hypothetical protein